MESEIFQGNALSAVDGKNRLSIPAFVRNVLPPAETRYVHVGKHPRSPCLTVYGDSYSRFLMERIKEDEEGSEDPFAIDDRERGLWGMGEKFGFDAGGRIVLNGLLRDLGQIGDAGLFVGRGRYAELWNPQIAYDVGGENLRLLAAYYLKRGGKA